MQDLEFPFLTSHVVSGLTGLSAKTLRQWDRKGILAAPRRARARKLSRTPRLYSWHEVGQLQQATHLLRTRRLPMGEVRRWLERSQSAALDRDWVIARPKPKVRRRSRAGAGGYGGSGRFSRTPTGRMR
jgi:DNA-binding transcriptional MerR regulator